VSAETAAPFVGHPHLIATTPEGSVTMKVSVPPTPHEVRMLTELCAMPGLAEATWTGGH